MAEGCMTEGAFQVHAHMIKCGLVCDVFVGTSLLHFYGTFGWVAEVDKVFKEIEEPNIVSWTSLMLVLFLLWWMMVLLLFDFRKMFHEYLHIHEI